MERVVIMVDGSEVDIGHIRKLLPDEETEAEGAKTLAEKLTAFERRLIQRELENASGNVAEAARALGLDRANLHRKIQRLGIRP